MSMSMTRMNMSMSLLSISNIKSSKFIQKFLKEFIQFIIVEEKILDPKDVRELSDEIYYEVEPCNVLNNETPEYMSNKVIFFNNKITRYSIQYVTVIGQSDIIGEKNKFSHLYVDNFEHIRISEELHGQAFYSKKLGKSGTRLILMTTPKKYLKYLDSSEKYYHLTGSTTSNYAHWLTEHLPKVLYIEDEKFTLIIDSDIHENLKNSLKSILRNKNFKVLELGPFENYFCKELNFISLKSFIPFEFRNIIDSPIKENDTNFCKTALLSLRNHCLKNIKKKNRSKIFISRNSTHRDFINQKDISIFFEKNGFKIINPANYSFEEQVQIFSSATHIVGQSGAGFANMIFSSTSCKLLMFATNLDGGNYRYFSNLASIFGQKIYYFECKNVGNSANIHSDIYVDMDILKNKINEIEYFK